MSLGKNKKVTEDILRVFESGKCRIAEKKRRNKLLRKIVAKYVEEVRAWVCAEGWLSEGERLRVGV